jgi:DNA-binding MarR family transcriptional regulator
MEDRAHEAARRIAGQCLAMRARRVDRVLSRLYDEALRPLGLRGTQLNLLTAIALTQPVRPADLARAMQLEKSSLSRNVARLVEQGWVHAGDAPDGRGRELGLTKAGARLLAAAEEAWAGAQRRARAELGDDLVDALAATGPPLPR